MGTSEGRKPTEIALRNPVPGGPRRNLGTGVTQRGGVEVCSAQGTTLLTRFLSPAQRTGARTEHTTQTEVIVVIIANIEVISV